MSDLWPMSSFCPATCSGLMYVGFPGIQSSPHTALPNEISCKNPAGRCVNKDLAGPQTEMVQISLVSNSNASASVEMILAVSTDEGLLDGVSNRVPRRMP